MTLEGQLFDKKSLRAITGRNPDWQELAKDCIAFATAQGGELFIGVEDDQLLPPKDQKISLELPDLIRKRIGELTVNVTVLPSVEKLSMPMIK